MNIEHSINKILDTVQILAGIGTVVFSLIIEDTWIAYQFYMEYMTEDAGVTITAPYGYYIFPNLMSVLTILLFTIGIFLIIRTSWVSKLGKSLAEAFTKVIKAFTDYDETGEDKQ